MSEEMAATNQQLGTGVLGSIKQIAAGTARRLLRFARIEPATIKALLRKPPQVHGGPRARRWPWPRRRHFDERERRAVLRVLDREIRDGNGIVYGGIEDKAYRQAFVEYLGGGYVGAVNSGTNALYVALKVLDLKPGSEVVVPPATDAGGTMPVVMNLCIPVPADSEPGSILTSALEIEKVLSERTSAIVVAHIGGYCVDMEPVMKLAAARGIPVIEDCAQAHGALCRGQMVGTFGAVSAFSTMYGKHHSTGAQGGLVFTKDPELLTKIQRVTDRGKPYASRGNPGNLLASLNFNQDEISMAIGRVQLEKLPGAIEARRTFASLVDTELRAVQGVSLIGDAPECMGSYLFLLFRLDPGMLSCDSDGFATALLTEGIEDVYGGYAVYPTDQPWHRDAVAFGTSGLPWSLNGPEKPRSFALSNIRQANKAIVRVDIHESLGVREAKDLVAAIVKIIHYYKT